MRFADGAEIGEVREVPCLLWLPFMQKYKASLYRGTVPNRRRRYRREAYEKGKTFWSCSNYPKCTFASWNRPVPQKCPRCGNGFLFEKRDRAGRINLFCLRRNAGIKSAKRHPLKRQSL